MGRVSLALTHPSFDRAPNPNSSPCSLGSVITTKTPRERLRSKVVHASEILHEQGPIGTFIHTNPLHGFEHVSLRDALHRRIMAVEEDRGLSLPLIEALRTAIEEEVRLFTRRRRQRGAILLGFCRIAGPMDTHQLPPLTFTEETQSRLRVRLPRGIGYPTGLMRLVDEVHLRKGFGLGGLG
jgi:hypothetical protein